MPRPFHGNNNMVDMQNNGYKSTTSAISEIVDNSIDWGATLVQIVLIRDTTRTHDEIDEILIIDDGEGMDMARFNKALQSNAGANSGARKGLGKYGMGLPNASISVTRRTEVYTKTLHGDILFNYLDLIEMQGGGADGALLPDVVGLPDFSGIPIIANKFIEPPRNGTIVRWVKPNRVSPKLARTLVRELEKTLGRTYKYKIVGDSVYAQRKTEIKIIVFDFNKVIYSKNGDLTKTIKPFDPLFLLPNTQAVELCGRPGPTSHLLVPEKIKKNFIVNYNGKDVEETVEIKISVVNGDLRQPNPDVNITSMREMYLYRNLPGKPYHNVSIVREGRELDQGGFGFINNVSDQRERWWSAEIIVRPAIDSIIGVDNKKQQASKIKYYDDRTDPDCDDTHPILLWISKTLATNIITAKREIEAQGATQLLGPGPEPLFAGPGGVEPGDPAPVIPGQIPENVRKKAIDELTQWIRERYKDKHITDEQISATVTYALNIQEHHIFIPSNLGATDLYRYQVFGTKVLIELNYTHSFYRECILPLEGVKERRSELSGIRLFISAMVNAEIVCQIGNRPDIVSDRLTLKNRMSESLIKYIDNMSNQA